MHSEPHPVKLFTNGPVVVPGGGRGAEVHWQLGTATIGDDSEAVDAELLFLGCRILEALNLGAFSIRINTVGDAAGRPVYQRALREFFRTHAKRISAKVTAEAKEQPFSALMMLAVEDEELAKEAPQSVDFLSEEARLYFRRLLEFLDEGKVPYVIDHTLLTTDDCASHTLWEFSLDPIAAANEMPSVPGLIAIRGGRMDRMAELLGGPKTSASGWVFDLSGIVTHLKAKGVDLPEPGARPKVFLSQLGEAAKKRSLLLFEDIRKSGLEVRYSLSRDTIKGQLRMAAKLGVRFALIFGQKEALEGTVIVREMDTGIQETIPQEKIIDELKKRLRAKP
jgi:histidyl-tRNA synthetase